jgi:hypothetical protein
MPGLILIGEVVEEGKRGAMLYSNTHKASGFLKFAQLLYIFHATNKFSSFQQNLAQIFGIFKELNGNL